MPCCSESNRLQVKRIQWCLAEAMRERDREFLRFASCGIIHQDAREPRFLVRFSVGP